MIPRGPSVNAGTGNDTDQGVRERICLFSGILKVSETGLKIIA